MQSLSYSKKNSHKLSYLVTVEVGVLSRSREESEKRLGREASSVIRVRDVSWNTLHSEVRTSIEHLGLAR